MPADAADQDRISRLLVAVLISLSALASLAVVALAARTGAWADLASGSAVPVAFTLAGALGARARPDAIGVRLLLLLGTLHLAAAALTGWAGEAPAPAALLWLMGALGDGAYLGGFAVLAALLACYPSGRATSRLQRAAVRLGVLAATAVLLDELLLHARLHLAAGIRVDSIAAPQPLPIIATTFDPIALVLLCVPVAVLVLVVDRRRRSEDERRATGWAILAGVVVVTLLAASPALDALAPGVNEVLFPIAVSVTPFLMLAGLVRYRILEVDLYVVRSLARAAVVLVVVGLAALATALLDRSGAGLVGAALTVAAVLGGHPLLGRLERLADRVVTGGRVRRDEVERELSSGWDTLRDEEMTPHAADLLRSAFDASWVRISSEQGVTVSGAVSGDPAISIPLLTPNAEVGRLDCGRRRGGWRAADQDLLRQAAARLALLLRDAALTRVLREQIAALEASRTRIVEAEDTARRRIERDLHDGVQQQIVALLARITLAREQSGSGSPVSASLLTAHELALEALTDLRLLVSGIAPAVLSDRGLAAAVESRAALLPIDVVVDADPRLTDRRLPAGVEGAAYFVIAEALANVMKHAGTDHARVVLAAVPEGVRVAVVDEGSGTAREDGGGISGLRDRVEALGGRLDLSSVPGVGTTLIADFPDR